MAAGCLLSFGYPTKPEHEHQPNTNHKPQPPITPTNHIISSVAFLLDGALVCWWVFGGWVAGGCLLPFNQPTKPTHDHQPLTTNHPPQTNNQPTNPFNMGSPHLMQKGWLVSGCWFVFGGRWWVASGCLRSFKPFQPTHTQPPTTNHQPPTTNHKPTTSTQPSLSHPV